MADTIHLVCLDAPSPPDYGGAIDMFYKIPALAASGVQIILHYFSYRKGRGHEGLEQYCREIHAYKRRSFLSSLPFSQPYITRSRENFDLVARLNRDRHPVLLEGLHCAGIARYMNDPGRLVIRMHNEEARYYSQLAAHEPNPLKQFYFKKEAALIQAFQQQLDRQLKLAVLSETDLSWFRDQGFSESAFIPCFIPWQQVNGSEGKGSYCLYHGNMAISENRQAAMFIIEKVFDGLNVPLKIAGKGMNQALFNAAGKNRLIELINNPSIEEINELIREAHIHLLPSMNKTGVKLKLLHALFEGRFCITNEEGVSGSGIHSGLQVANSAEAFREQVSILMQQHYTSEHSAERKKLELLYNNHINAGKLIALWKHYP